jgi:hypothetical protein
LVRQKWTRLRSSRRFTVVSDQDRYDGNTGWTTS